LVCVNVKNLHSN